MNGDKAMLAELAGIEAAAAQVPACDVLICPPFTLIDAARARVQHMHIGAQDVHPASHGAYTGDISVAMLKEAGAQAVIVGHSERRDAHHETDAQVRAKAESVMGAGLRAVVCIGESLELRDAGAALTVVERQLGGSVPEDGDFSLLAIAYEPIWAIGSGRIPTAEELIEVHGYIRSRLGILIGAAAQAVPILYGGSVNAENVASIMATPDIDGVLVGGASLSAAKFVPIIQAAALASR